MENTGRCSVIIEPVSKRVNIAKGKTVYDALIALNFPIGAFCGGAGVCGKCRIKIIEPTPNISEPNEKEVEKLGKDKIATGWRLACQTKVNGDVRVFLDRNLIPTGNRILVDSDLEALGLKIDVPLDTNVISRVIDVEKPVLKNPVSDWDRILKALNNSTGSNFSLKNLRTINDTIWDLSRKIPHVLREKDGRITTFLRKYPNDDDITMLDIIDVSPGESSHELFGLAVDIGTTTIVGYLINLITGEIASLSAILNPQVAIGEDVVSRMTYIMNNPEGVKKAQELVIDALNQILKDTCDKANVTLTNVKDIVIVGNTAMHHMFFGLPTRYLGLSPFIPAFKAPINIRANLLGLSCNPNANVYSPPVVAGYVGTDTIGCIVASRIDTYDDYTLLIDIGTNGELVLGNKEGLITGSCAAGSALEGAQIEFGMRAAEGAIEEMTIDPKTLEPSMSVIGKTTPVGICGSGLIDLTAEMLRAKIITRKGKFNNKDENITSNKRIFKDGNNYKYIIYNPEWDRQNIKNLDLETIEDKNRKEEIITISQDDIRQVQLAKGAFLSGALLLLEKDNKLPSDVKKVILAGAFGSYINKENAMFIGLFPEVLKDRIYQIGNAAGLGAQMCLKNINSRRFANDIALKVKYHEISSSKEFQIVFAKSLYFPHHDLDQFPNLKKEYESLPF
ncbi:MAG: ASKHA domain-containing protein [Promethearchaeota archaeon]